MKHTKRYFGLRGTDGEFFAYVEIDGKVEPLDPRTDLVNHSPTGVSWGYLGSGPAQLALAILAHCVSVEIALRLHQRFKDELTSRLDPERDWSLNEEQVRFVVRRLLERKL